MDVAGMHFCNKLDLEDQLLIDGMDDVLVHWIDRGEAILVVKHLAAVFELKPEEIV